MKKASLGDRLRYRFDNFMARGTIALVGALFAVTLLLVLAATAIILLLVRLRLQGSAESMGFAEALWQVTMRTIDTGTVAGDVGWAYRLVGFLITLGGIFIVSALIGVLASGLDTRLGELRRGRSRVIETGHTVILGWSPQVFSIISELALANRQARDAQDPAATGRSACVAILADRDKVEMEEEIHTKVPDLLGTRVVCRSGDPLDPDDLRIVSPDTARAIMVLSPGGPYPDLPVAKTMMALARDRDRREHRYHIVAAIHKATNLQIARLIGGDEAQVFAVDNLISRLIAQTCRQSGLSIVYGELFSFEGAVIHFHAVPDLTGITYGQALFRFPNATLIGLRYSDGRVAVNPPMDTVLRAGDKLIAIAASVADMRPSIAKHSGPGPGDGLVEPATGYSIDRDAIRLGISATPPLERILILGWNRRGPMILEQLGYYMPVDSRVLVVAPVDPQQMQAECAVNQPGQIQVTFERGNPADRLTLERLAAGGYQYVVILSPADASDIQIADASTMVPLLHLRDIARKAGTVFAIVSEVLDVRNRDLSEVTSADDVIISERLVALALTQIAENRDVLPVFGEFLNTGGPEIYLKPAGDYVVPGRPVNFYTVLEAARRKGQTAIGYRLLAEASQPDRAFGVRLNPDKAAQFTLAADDRIIVLAEE
jgi:Trk K+ transport system NAD-binding subunit